MPDDSQKQIERLFQQAVGLPEVERNAFLDAHPALDPARRREVEALLRAFDDAGGSFLHSPIDPATDPDPGSDPGASATRADPRPEAVGRYPVLDELGRGGMGVVYRARDPELEREVAIKVLPGATAGDPGWLERFRREARMLASLNHPNIATVYSLEESGPVTFITMELVEGELLVDRTRRGALPLDDALPIGQQIGAALQAAHQRFLVHRDLKPHNVIVTPEGRVKVLDFGLARTVEGDAAHADGVMGTPGYMSPEQLRGEASGVACDVWAFGCVLFECLTGLRAFDGATAEERIEATLESGPRWEALPSALPERVRTVLERCLVRDPARRLERVAIARREIEEAMAARARPVRADSGGVRTSSTPNNLPVPLTSFVGRVRDTRHLSRILTESRVVTLVGPGGCGKSRLAVEIARQLLGGFPDGVRLVELAAVLDPDDVADQVSATLEVPSDRDWTHEAAIADAIGDRRMLVILDNCEHVLDTVAPLAQHLARSCPDLVLLATSRESLGIPGEVLHPVSSLEEDAMLLFEERAFAASPGFTITDQNRDTVETICRRLDGIPLAIELAAARVRLVPVDDIAHRLDDRFRLLTAGARTALPRHQTLRALIDWSHEHLDEHEQRFFARLSVFVGGFTLEAAESVCTGDGVDAWEALDLLSRLVDKSLVEAVPTDDAGGRARFRMLETIRAYAAEALGARDETAAIEARHREHFADLAGRADERLLTPDQTVAIRELDADIENLRAAIDRGLGGATIAPRTLDMLKTVLQFLSIRARWREGTHLGRAALAHAAIDDQPLEAVGHIHHRLGNLARPMLDLDGASRHYDAAMEIWEKTGRRRNQAAVMNNRGLVAHHAGDAALAVRLFEDALAINREIGNHDFASTNLNNLGLIATENDRVEEAAEYFGQALEMARELDLTVYIANFCDNLATVLGKMGDDRRARELHEESIALNREIGNRAGVAVTLHNLASILLDEEDHDEARKLLRESLAIKYDLGDRRGLIFTLESFSDLAWRTREWTLAVCLMAPAAREREALDAPAAQAQKRHIDTILAGCRAELGDRAYEEAWREGRTLSMDAAVSMARGDDVS